MSESWKHVSVELACRSIGIGSYKGKPADRVQMTAQGVKFTVVGKKLFLMFPCHINKVVKYFS